MKHYTYEQAIKEIGRSIAWRDARKVSIKKWKEIVEYGTEFYNTGNRCGYCLVMRNRRKKGLSPSYSILGDCLPHCPAGIICSKVDVVTPETTLKNLRELKR